MCSVSTCSAGLQYKERRKALLWKKFAASTSYLQYLRKSNHTYNVVGRTCLNVFTRARVIDKVQDNRKEYFFPALAIHSCNRILKLWSIFFPSRKAMGILTRTKATV